MIICPNMHRKNPFTFYNQIELIRFSYNKYTMFSITPLHTYLTKIFQETTSCLSNVT